MGGVTTFVDAMLRSRELVGAALVAAAETGEVPGMGVSSAGRLACRLRVQDYAGWLAILGDIYARHPQYAPERHKPDGRWGEGRGKLLAVAASFISYSDIAQQTGLTRGTVESYVSEFSGDETVVVEKRPAGPGSRAIEVRILPRISGVAA